MENVKWKSKRPLVIVFIDPKTNKADTLEFQPGEKLPKKVAAVLLQEILDRRATRPNGGAITIAQAVPAGARR